MLRRLLTIEPDFTIERFLSKTPLETIVDRNHYAEGLAARRRRLIGLWGPGCFRSKLLPFGFCRLRCRHESVAH